MQRNMYRCTIEGAWSGLFIYDVAPQNTSKFDYVFKNLFTSFVLTAQKCLYLSTSQQKLSSHFMLLIHIFVILNFGMKQ